MPSQTKFINYYVLITFTGLSYLSLNSIAKASLPNSQEIISDRLSNVGEPSRNISSPSVKQEIISDRSSNTGEPSHNISSSPKFKNDTTDLIRKLKRQDPPLLEQTPSQTISPPEPTNSATKVKIKEVKVLGSTVFSKAKLDEIVQPFNGKQAEFAELLAIRAAITDLYTKSGYTTSGAFLPPQDISSGVVAIQVVEGELEKVEILGLRRLRTDYVLKRIRLAAKTPLNLRRLETALQLLQLDPLFTSVQAELKAGTTPGRSVLVLTLKEAAPINAAFTIENRDSPSVGSIRGTATLSDQNLLGFGDRLTGEISYTAGSDNYDINYGIPLNARDGTLSLRYANSNSRIIEEPFSPLDILGHTKTFSVGFRQPVIRTPSSEFTLSFTTDLRESRTYLLKNIPYSFSTGPENGKSKVTVLRFGQEWINRTPQRVLAARSQFNIGIDALGATVNNTGVDGRFFSWLGQFQLVQKLGKDVVGVARIATQLSPNSLLPLEQFSFGGVDTVRGYRQNQFVADNGITGSLEVRFPVVNNPKGFGTLQVAPFVDIGKAWNTNDIGVDNRLFASTGLSLRWQYDRHFSARLDWGIPLTSVRSQGDSLQDNGLFFSVMYQPF